MADPLQLVTAVVPVHGKANQHIFLKRHKNYSNFFSGDNKTKCKKNVLKCLKGITSRAATLCHHDQPHQPHHFV